jgi:hypothetical protein
MKMAKFNYKLRISSTPICLAVLTMASFWFNSEARDMVMFLWIGYGIFKLIDNV